MCIGTVFGEKQSEDVLIGNKIGVCQKSKGLDSNVVSILSRREDGMYIINPVNFAKRV
jgi:hypothetical protein